MRQIVNDLFHSKVYEEIVKNRDMDPQSSFCYAGIWGFGVDFATGGVTRCHNSVAESCKCFYDEIDKEFNLCEPIACSCGIESCCMQYNFFAEGLIPAYNSGVLYGDMIYKKGLITDYVRQKLNVRFDEMHPQFTAETRERYIVANKNRQIDDLMRSKNPFLQEEIYQNIQEGKKIAIYGTGNYYLENAYAIGFEWEYFIDSFVKDGETTIDGKAVRNIYNISDNELSTLFIVISIRHREEVVMLLEERGLAIRKDFI